MDYNNESEEDFIVSESGEIYTKKERDFKGIWIPKEIYFLKDISWMEKALLYEIDSLSKMKGCFASNKYFASFFNVSEHAISVSIRKLKKLGFVEQIAFDGRKRIIKAYIQGSKKGQGCLDQKVKTCNSTCNSTISSKEEISVSHETHPAIKVLTSGKGFKEKQQKEISAKLELHPFATKAILYWNTLPNITPHKKPSKTWLEVIKSLNMLKSGKLYKKRFDKDFLKKYNIPESMLKHKFKKPEILITLKKVSGWCQQGFLMRDADFPTSLPNAIYNSHSFFKSVFLIACVNDLKPAIQKIENKFPEITDYFQKKTRVILNDKELNQLCRTLIPLFNYHKQYVFKKAIGYHIGKLFGDFKSMCKTYIDWLVDNDKTRNIDKDFKYSVFGFKPDSIMFKKFIKYYEKALNCSLSSSFSRF